MLQQRAFVNIFGDYNDSKAFVDTFNINAYDDLPSSSSSKGYENSSSIDVNPPWLKGLTNNFG